MLMSNITTKVQQSTLTTLFLKYYVRISLLAPDDEKMKLEYMYL